MKFSICYTVKLFNTRTHSIYMNWQLAVTFFYIKTLRKTTPPEIRTSVILAEFNKHVILTFTTLTIGHADTRV